MTGSARVGKRLVVKSARWSPTPSRLSYQWLRNGKPIGGAVKTHYRLKSKDRGKRVSVRVTAQRAGYATASKVSKTKRVLRAR
jgi:hypothetical protein